MRHSRDSNARGLSKPVVYGTAGYRTGGLAESNGSSGQLVSGMSNQTLYIGGGIAIVGGVLLWTLSSSGSGKRTLPERA